MALKADITEVKILITKYGGTKECFENMAEYVDSYLIFSIYQRIEKLLRRKSNHSLRDHIKKHFTEDKITKEIVKVYKQVL